MRPLSSVTSKYFVPGHVVRTTVGSVNWFLDVSLASIAIP